MSFDWIWLLIIATFLFGLYRYYKQPVDSKRRNSDHHQRQGLFLIVIAVIAAVVYYYSKTRGSAPRIANMNGGALAACQQELNSCASQYRDKIQQANRLWEDHQQLQTHYNQLSQMYEREIGLPPVIQPDDIDDITTMLQARLYP